MSAKETTLQNIEKANSNYYKAIKSAHSVAYDVLNGLTIEEIELLASLPKEKLTIKVGFSLWDVIKTAFGK